MDKRKSPRLDSVFEIIVRSAKTGSFVGRVINVSEDGLSLVRKEPLDVDSLVHLKMALPTDFCDKDELSFCAQVRWCEVKDDPPQYIIGIQILEFRDGLRGILRRLMKMTCFNR